jgi:hypothetical protein
MNCIVEWFIGPLVFAVPRCPTPVLRARAAGSASLRITAISTVAVGAVLKRSDLASRLLLDDAFAHGKENYHASVRQTMGDVTDVLVNDRGPR